MAMVTTSRTGNSSAPLITHKVSTVSQPGRKPSQSDVLVSQNGRTQTEKTVFEEKISKDEDSRKIS